MSRLFVCLALYACLCEARHILDAVNDYEDPIQKQFDVVVSNTFVFIDNIT